LSNSLFPVISTLHGFLSYPFDQTTFLSTVFFSANTGAVSPFEGCTTVTPSTTSPRLGLLDVAHLLLLFKSVAYELTVNLETFKRLFFGVAKGVLETNQFENMTGFFVKRATGAEGGTGLSRSNPAK
jgi:hypothetical protein